MTLPIFKDQNQNLMLMQTNWSAALNPVINNAANQPVILKSVALINGSTMINHTLGRKLQGWKIVRQRASASIYDTQDTNQTPALTLMLTSNAAVTVDLEVF